MSLRFILGGPGTGKTTACIREIFAWEEREDKGALLYIVPEQFSLQSERTLVTHAPGHGIMRAQVLSFQRLAYHVFGETGGNDRVVLEEIGKGMLLRKIVNDLKTAGALGFFGVAADKQGFIDQLARTITEFYHYGVTADKLAETAGMMHGNEGLRLKLTDLQKILTQYYVYQQEKYITSDETLDMLADKIAKSSLLAGAHIWLDGFHGFTPQEYRVIEGLMLAADHINVTLPIGRQQAENPSNWPDSYGEIRRVYERLRLMAANHQLDITEPTECRQLYRLEHCPDLLYLAKNYMESRPEIWNEDVAGIRLYSASNAYTEVENAAAQIIELTRDYGYRYHEIGLLACDLPSYEKSMHAVFAAHGIPVFMDSKSDILSHPLIELVRAALDVLADRWSYESVFRLLKTGLTGFTWEETDSLENYVLAFGIQGERWAKEWTYGFESSYECFDRDMLNSLREKIRELLSPLTDHYAAGKQYTIRELSQGVMRFLIQAGVTARLEAWANRQMETGEIRQAREHSQVWRKLTEILDKAVEILGDEKMKPAAYAQILDAGFAQADLGAIPPSLDQVVVGSLRRSRMSNVKALIVLGANEGVLPARIAPEGLLSEDERQTLSIGYAVALSPSAYLQTLEEQYLIYMAFCLPSHRLSISYYRGGLDGKAALPSTVIKKLLRLFPSIQERNVESVADPDLMGASARFAVQGFIRAMAGFREKGGISSFYQDIYACLQNDQDALAKIQFVLDALEDDQRGLPLDEPALDILYGKILKTSVSRLEKYEQCPFSYFTQYNLHAAERKLYEIQGFDLGNLFHEILDDFTQRLHMNHQDWRNKSAEELYIIAEACINSALEKETNAIFQHSRQYAYFAYRAKQIALRSIDAMMTQLKSGDFDPGYSEAVFGGEGQFDAIDIPLNEHIIMRMEGRIDRVDLLTVNDKQYVKIIDYKSGSVSFSFPEVFYGLQMQLIVYLHAFMEQYRQKTGKNKGALLPAAVLYFRLDNPYLDFEKLSSKEALRDALYKTYRMSGVVLDDINIIKKIDSEIAGRSPIIPVGIKSGTAFQKLLLEERPLMEYSSVLSPSAFQGIMDYTFHKARMIGHEILSGQISPMPYQYNHQTGCAYCLFKPVCRFDPVQNAGMIRRMDAITAKEALDEILKIGIDKSVK